MHGNHYLELLKLEMVEVLSVCPDANAADDSVIRAGGPFLLLWLRLVAMLAQVPRLGTTDGV
jgi:hypothetical protein